MKSNSAERRLAAQIAANTRWSREDPAANAERGQAGLVARLAREVDPDGTLPPAERARRVECARRAHMAKLSLASAQSRRRARELAAQADAAEAELAALAQDELAP